MLNNLLQEDQELKRVALTPNDQKPRFEWSALTQEGLGMEAPDVKVRVGNSERDFDLGEIADTVGNAITDLLLARQQASNWCRRSRGPSFRNSRSRRLRMR